MIKKEIVNKSKSFNDLFKNLEYKPNSISGRQRKELQIYLDNNSINYSHFSFKTKLNYKTVKQFFTDNGCKLISTTYQTNKNKLEYICKCGHNRISCYDHVKRYKQFNCKNCTINKYFINGDNNLHMHPKTFKKMIKVMESKYEKCLKYRDKFKSSELIKCSDCNQQKKIMYYYPFNLKNKICPSKPQRGVH